VPLTPEFDAPASDWTVSEDGVVYFTAEDHGKVPLYTVPLSGGKPRAIVMGGSIRKPGRGARGWGGLHEAIAGVAGGGLPRAAGRERPSTLSRTSTTSA
jgi:hypothetical protein